MVQQVKDLALSLLWLRFSPWPRNFYMPQGRQKIKVKKKKKKRQHFRACPLTLLLINLFLAYQKKIIKNQSKKINENYQ